MYRKNVYPVYSEISMGKSQTIYYYYIVGNSLQGILHKEKNKNKKYEFTQAPWCGR